MKIIEITYQKDLPGYAYGDTLQTTHLAGQSNGTVTPIVYDPSLLTGHDYRIDFSPGPDETVVWNLTDVTTNTVLLDQQSILEEKIYSPVIDGLQLIVEDVAFFDFFNMTVDGNGYYSISSYYYHEWAATARAIDVFGRGTTDKKELEKDYELRFTGEYEDPNANIVRVKDGTGSMATIFDGRFYNLDTHPMNPNPGSTAPFVIRIPFEVWNIDDNRQVNFLIYDRSQVPSDVPFFAFNANNLASGIYLYRIDTGLNRKTKKFILIK